MYDTDQSFIGKGWHFPPAFSRVNNAAQMAVGIADIEQSIHIILATIPGERLMQPDFGCNTNNFSFEQIDTRFTAKLNDAIQFALLMFEPRVDFIGAEVSHINEVDSIVYVIINFLIVTANTRHNIVYPFYLNEGTNIPDTM